MDDTQQPRVSSDEVAAAFSALYPDKFQSVFNVLMKAKRDALEEAQQEVPHDVLPYSEKE